ncbi:RdgB/HAM1 family non-canonical purine NTP pyrophosphatase [Anaerobiospirillum thomasii]|uniref:dITP/XTP pyrophosphatase n=1 Tax=Anaerobiospirillum thomasii TaxID=179995 RepID=A0A2X0V690_9GAMM|nr:RdgB/HAM1 family non-canonical purine NTP pyrophosphatase [Anaerobiospirillum thomasii]SPT69964.1 Non-canonical purine NTP pyrophosphatase [Anaerobiospirillum thomasii]
MTYPKTIVLASNNEHKAREVEAMLEVFNIKVVPQKNFNVPDVAEDGKSFIQNALIKAYNASAYASMPALADDSGICVDALNGAPGIFSARYAGVHGDDKGNNKKLLEELAHVKADKRTARFVCALAFVRQGDDPTPLIATASWEGMIGFEERGANGFGYDPLFYLKDRHASAAQIPPQLKNLLSHRFKAMQQMLELLRQSYAH